MLSDLPVPELFLRLFHQERLQWVANLISHVGVRQIQTSQNLGLQLKLLRFIAIHHLTHQHVNKHNVCRVDEGDILKHIREKGKCFQVNLITSNAWLVDDNRGAKAEMGKM